jgi:CBS domain-containing protein
MEAEHLEILNFLRRFPPFNELPEDELVELAKNTEISYFKAGSQVLEYNESISDLYVIRNGSLETYNRPV